jgi:lipopolysaccharide assembly outer membrane protein LptD (OstA)
MRLRLTACLLLLCCLLVSAQGRKIQALQKLGIDENTELRLSADKMEYSQDNKLAKATGQVVVEYGQLRLTAEKAEINQETLDFLAQGNVVLDIAGQGRWTAPAVKGNISSQTFEFGPFRADSEIWHFGGDSGHSEDNGDAILTDAWLSTCDCPEPHYCLSARKITHHQDKTFTAKHVFLRFGGVPVFYLPWLWGSTSEDAAGIIFRPGYSGKRGAYLLLGRLWKFGDLDGHTSTYIDAMTKRGIGIGLDNEYSLPHGGRLESQLYGIHDQDAPGKDGYDRRFKDCDDRYRLQLSLYQPVVEGLTFRLNADVLSDISMLEDWFRSDYNHIYQPKSFADLTYENHFFSLGLQVRPRLNDFYTVVESLPELRLQIPETRIAELPVTYSSSNTAGYYQMKWRKFDLARTRPDLEDFWYWNRWDEEEADDGYLRDPADYSAFRFDSLHTLALPWDAADWLTITPRASFRATSYNKSSKRKVSRYDLADRLLDDNPDVTVNDGYVVDYDKHGGSVLRLASEFGLETRSIFYSDWLDWNSELWEISGIRHTFEPYLNYVYAPEPTEDCDHLYFFDEIDRLEKQHFLRLGLDQQWQVKNRSNRPPLARWQTYADLHFDKGEDSGKHQGDLGNRLQLWPRQDFSIFGVVLYDMGEGCLQRGEFGFKFGAEKEMQLGLSYIYRRNHFSRTTYSMGSNLVDFTGESNYLKKYFEKADTMHIQYYQPLNEKTWFEGNWEYDFDKSKLSEHNYTLYRVLHCWTMGIGFGWDNSDFEAMLLFRLTAYPNIKIHMGF